MGEQRWLRTAAAVFLDAGHGREVGLPPLGQNHRLAKSGQAHLPDLYRSSARGFGKCFEGSSREVR
jgi:hypothetical protein